MKLFITTILIFTMITGTALAMSSANFSISEDSINIGGTEGSASANFRLSDTIGDLGTGESSSANYYMHAGFRKLDTPATLAFALSGNVIDLGVLSQSIVSSGSVTAITTTNASNGYNILVNEDQEFKNQANDIIPDVVISPMVAGTSAYGLRTAGAIGLYNSSDTAISSNLKTIASGPGNIVNQTTDIIIKAAINGLTPSGSYQNKITVICVASF